MSSIDDFVTQRWQDAKHTLHQLDPDFVDKLEAVIQLDTLGLSSPWLDIPYTPKRRLSKKWHRLLEACLELTMALARLRTCAQSFDDKEFQGMLDLDAGQRVDYHFVAVYTNAVTLSERVEEVIRRSVDIYVPDKKIAKALIDKHKKQVWQVIKHFNSVRDDLLHAYRSFFASTITKLGYWEGNVTIGLTPQKFLYEFRFPAEGKRVRAGKYIIIMEGIARLAESHGEILNALEKELERYRQQLG